ncbi:hypothetical protein A9Z42_0058900 [Trichoderma parareesei]|uniref:BZIP domain-containing protein n=1 Tax=Trichoderma parareesei TaxID=858221 RepID=A0A2H3A1N2_TRIPA|nr:hypothetical protein A9Z42_0058900 [Trichoderma parareesei]
MPRKFITQEVKDQNRESQRRSRARRLELINDLKNQVEEYQRRGATASLEMQRLAQAVTHENQRLRSLLSERGVSQEEIQRYLSASSAPQFKLSDALYPSEPGSLRCEACGSTSILREAQPAMITGRQSDSYHSSPQPISNGLKSVSPSSASLETIHRGDSTTVDAAALALQPVMPAVVSDAIPGDKPSSHATTSCPGSNHARNGLGHTDDMETSCDTAASILVDLHHQVDPQRARAALGCKGSSSCTVSNIKIFQLLDNFPE